MSDESRDREMEERSVACACGSVSVSGAPVALVTCSGCGVTVTDTSHLERMLRDARDERDRIRAWLCDNGLDEKYAEACDVAGCPKQDGFEDPEERLRLLESALACGCLAFCEPCPECEAVREAVDRE